MSGKKVRWTSRRRRRFNSTLRRKKLLWWALAAAALIAAWLFPVSALRQAPSARPVEPEAKAPSAISGWLLHKMMADTIPGMEPPGAAANAAIRGAVFEAFYALTGVDPRDPRSILERELGAGTRIALPVLHPPEAGGEAGADPDLPQEPGEEEQVPVFNPQFPFLGYSEPVALIYHTHITETFEPTFGLRYSQNLNHTVARLGEQLVTLLQDQYGLPLIHHRGIYDLPRNTAYEKIRPVIKEIMAENPQLDMVIDLHRDGVRREITTTTFPEGDVSKILIVIGTRHPGWESNLALALCLNRELETVAPGLSRGIRQYNEIYNQDLHAHSILIEIGGHENTLEEAQRAVPYLAEALARAYYRFFEQNE